MANDKDKDGVGAAIAGAALNAVTAGMPALVAAAGGLVGKLFKGEGKGWNGAGEGVHDWFTKYGHQAFLDWMKKNHPNDFGTLDGVKALAYTWADGGEAFLDTNDPNYWIGNNRDKTNAFFASMGIDLPASQAHNKARGGDGNRISVKLDSVPLAPSRVVVDELQRVQDKASAGVPLTPNEKHTNNALKSVTADDLGLGTLLPILLVVVLVYLVLRA